MSQRAVTIDESASQSASSLLSLKAKKVKRVYDSVSKEYSSWSQQYCQQILQSLSKPVSEYSDPEVKNKKPKKPNPSSSASTSSATCTISDYDADGLRYSMDNYSIDTRTISTDELEIEKAIPYAPYHSCTSISQNILVGDDSDYLPFIPFADDENYNYSQDLELHRYTAWQKSDLSFDEEYTLFETIRRLLSDGELSIENIEHLPMEYQRIVHFPKNCDIPKSFPFQGSIPPIIRNQTPSSAIGYFLEYFCSNLNCTTGFCPLHEGDLVKAQVPKHIPPKTLPTTLSTMIPEACGSSCSLIASSISNSIHTIWTPKDCEILAEALRYAPDTTSCDLAIICRKPCREVQKLRKGYSYPLVRPRPMKAKQAAQIKSRSFEPCLAGTTGHATRPQIASVTQTKGIATQDVDATKLVQEGGKVARVRSQKGSAAPRNVHVIEHISNVIPRYAPLVEQDDTHHLCRNTGIQRGMFKETEVRESKWGLGLFLLEDCEEDDLVSEYVGEMIGPLTVESRKELMNVLSVRAEHRQRSYVFNLNPMYALDSVYAGNTTRYMNHSFSASNCHTKVMFVNSEHRIGVYAARRLEKGEELLIDYGIDFWKSKGGEKSLDSLASLPPPTFEDPKDLTYVDATPDGTIDD